MTAQRIRPAPNQPAMLATIETADTIAQPNPPIPAWNRKPA